MKCAQRTDRLPVIVLVAMVIVLNSPSTQGQPVLTSFSLNMTPPERLLLTFNSNVVQSCNALTLQNGDLNPTSNISIQPLRCEYDSSPTMLEVTVDESDWLLVQADISLATTTVNTFLSLDEGFTTDISTTPSAPAIIPVGFFTPNSNPPIVQGGIVFVQNRLLGLMFSEGVNVSSVDFTGVSFSFTNITTGTRQSYTLTGGFAAAGDTGNQLGILLTLEDFDILRQAGTNSSDILLTIAADTILDGNGMPNLFQENVPLFDFVLDDTPPEINSFTLDLNVGALSLSFTEVVLARNGDINYSLFFLANTDDTSTGNLLSLAGSTFLNETVLIETVVDIALPLVTLDIIKRDGNFCSSGADCFIFWGNNSFVDLSNNSATEPTFGIPGMLVEDTTRPVLVSFSLDLMIGHLNLTFSEPVDGDAFAVSSLTFTDGASQQEAINGTAVQGGTTFSSEISIILSSESLNFAKLLGSPRLSTQSTATTDAAGNFLVELSVADSIQPASIVRDETPPILLGFIPSDPSNREIALTFDEVVNTATWNGSQLFITLQISLGDVTYTGFTTGTLAPAVSIRIVYTFSDTDFSGVFSSQYMEAYNSGAIVLRAGGGLIQDAAGNPLGPTESFTFTTQPEDTTPPSLISFDLDMDVGRVQLAFSEPVNILNVSGQVQFVDSGNFVNITQVYDLTGVAILTTGEGPVPTVDLNLSRTDLNAIKVNRQLCTSSANTFVVIRAGLAQDRNSNPVQPASSGTPVSNYVPDTSPPTVEHFDIDMDLGEMVLYFSEPVLINSAFPNFTQFRLNSVADLQAGISLANYVITSATHSDSVLVGIFATNVLVNSIKFDAAICTSASNCLLHYAAGSFSDTAGNTALDTSPDGLLPQRYFPDVTTPSLLSFAMDLNTGSFSLTFSEPIDASSFNLSGLTLLSEISPNISNVTYSPTEATLIMAGSMNTVLTFSLGPPSLNQVKLLFTNNSSSLFLAISPLTAQDLALPANLVTPIPVIAPLQASTLVMDTTAPILVRFTPAASPSLNDITFIFDEFVNGASFDENAFTITLTTRQGRFEYSSFSNGMITSILRTDELVYTFSQSDFNTTVSGQYAEAVSNGSVSLVAANGFIRDLFGNIMSPLLTPLQFSTDTTRPTLIGYALDLNTGLLALTFSELVNVLSVSGRAQLQDRADGPGVVISFAENGTLIPASAASDVVSVQLGTNDLNSIKTNQNIGTSLSNTFLSLEAMFAADISGNLLSPGASAVQASSVTLDTSRPFLTSFSVDINQGRVMLLFSESIATNSLDTSRLYLTAMLQNQLSGYNLSDSTYSEPAFSSSVMLQLSQELLNRVKSEVLVCSSRSNCFAFVAAGALTDVSGNTVVPSTTGTLAATVLADSVPPRLAAYTMDLDTGIIFLTFSEPVLVSSFNPSGITANAAGLSQQLLDTSILSAESLNTVLQLMAGSGLLNQLKFLDSSGTVTLSVSSNSVTDTSGLSVAAIPPTDLFAPVSFVADTTPPNLLQFIPSSGQLGLTLVFDEFILPATIAGNLLSFTLKNRNGQFDYPDFSSAIITQDISDRVTLTFPPSETRFTDNAFLQLYALSYNEGSICLNLAALFVSDLSSNGYAGSLVAVYTNTTDNERPELVSFTLNLNTSILNLTFSEGVNVLTIAGNVRFQSSVSSAAVMYTLMNGTVVTAQESASNIVTVAIDSMDITNLVNLPSLATSVSNTYLFLSERFAVDFSGNLLNNTLSANQASNVVQVIRGTVILGFDLDLDSDIMTLEFDRGVIVSTFDPSRITLTNVSSLAETSRADVHLGRVELLSPPGSVLTMFRFLFSVNDTVNIKRSTLCYQRANCFASFTGDLVRDATGNTTLPMVLQVRTLFVDVTPPRLVAFRDFDLDRGTFTLIFSEPVNGSSATFTDVQFSDRVANPSVNITLREGFTTPDHIEIDFNIDNRDLNAIKLLPGLCTTRENCWVRLPSFFINDVGMNPFLHSSIQPDAQASFHQPLGFIADETPPIVNSFDVNINTGVMTLFFSEVILQTTFYPDNLTLLNAPNGGVTLVLARDTSFNRSATGDVITLVFTTSDLNSIKSQNQLFTSGNTSFLSLVSNLLVDTSANLFAPLTVSNPQRATTFVPDFTRPNLVTFDLYNNDNGTIIISFDEPVDTSTLSFTGLTLIAGSSSTPSSVALTGGTVNYLRQDDGRLSLVVSMTSNDLRAVKLITNLATGRENTFISITSDAVSDFSGNQVTGLPQSSPLQLNVDGFVSDSSRASLAGYTFDLTNATISLTFTDVLDISTLVLTQLTLQNNQSSPSESLSLMDSSTSSRNADSFVVNLGTQDLAAIQSSLGLATMESNTYLSFDASLIRDVSGLEVIGVPSSSAIRPIVYIADSVTPTIVSFSLDMNVGTFSVTFSEPILLSTLTLQGATLQNSMATPTTNYTLTNSTYQASGMAASIVPITISDAELNTIKSLTDLASSRIDTYLNVARDFVSDTNSNPIQPTVLQVTAYIPDSIPPVLLSFDFHRTTMGVIELRFSEAISYAGDVQRSIVLQNTAVIPSVSRILSQADTVRNLPVLDTVQITLGSALLLDLLNNLGIAESTSTLFISIAAGSFRDYAGNGIAVIPSNQAMQVRFIYRPCPTLSEYNNITLGVCLQCPRECVSSCTGSLPIAGPRGCDRCHITTVTRNGTQEFCLDGGNSCPPAYFDNAANSPLPSDVVCQPCSPECLSCRGPSNTNCQSCGNSFVSPDSSGPITQCLASCAEAAVPGSCRSCHQQCTGCTGPSNQLCVQCRYESLTLEGSRTCVPRCENGQFLARVTDTDSEHECRTCHEQCANCTGPANTKCLQCRRANSTVSGVTTCLENCPANTYESDTGLCQACHVLCSGGCTGASSRECSSCVENSVLVGEGVVECTPFCSLGKVYDSEADTCQLTLTLEIIIIVCSAVGGLLILVVLFIILCVCYKCCLSRGKLSMSKDVYFLGAKDRENYKGADVRSHTTGL